MEGLALVSVGAAAENATPDIVQAKQVELSKWRRNASMWTQDRHTLPELMVFRAVHEGHRMLMRDLLAMSGAAWQRREAWKELTAVQSGADSFCARHFRLTVAQSGRPPCS